MIKYLSLLTFLITAEFATAGSPRAPFGVQQYSYPLFGIRAGADPKPKDDYERAADAIFHGMEQVEARLQKAVEEEVHSIFDNDKNADLDHAERAKVVGHAKTAVEKGASKIKSSAREYHKAQKQPLWPDQDDKDIEQLDHKILHAIEAAEKAVLHAVQEEVDTLFHETHDENHPLKDEPATTAKKAKQGIKKGVEKAKKHVDEAHKERQGWIKDNDSLTIEEYMKAAGSMYGMGF